MLVTRTITKALLFKLLTVLLLFSSFHAENFLSDSKKGNFNLNISEIETIQKIFLDDKLEDYEIGEDKFTLEELQLIKKLKNEEEMIKTQTSKPLTMTYSEKVVKAGFEFEEHKIITEDGYILTAWRIPRKRGEDVHTRKPPVLLQHGLLDDAYTWFAFKNASDCLPIMLAERGFDLWVTNSRGSMFSNEHIDPEFNPDGLRSKYWNFTWHEMAKYDVKAHIEFIKERTGYEKIRWVGHSQGTFQFYISYLLNPEYMENNILKFGSLGNIATIFNSYSPVLKVLKYTKILNIIRRFFSDNFLDLGTHFSKITRFFCTKLTFICKTVINLIIETKITNRVNWKEMSDLYFYEPGGSSTKNVIHWVQVYDDQVLGQFDYGKKLNLKIYGSEKPPEYDLSNWSNWSIPSFIINSDADPFSTEKDLEFFLSHVHNKQNFFIKKLTNYNHLDYLWSIDAKKDIYFDLIEFLR